MHMLLLTAPPLTQPFRGMYVFLSQKLFDVHFDQVVLVKLLKCFLLKQC